MTDPDTHRGASAQDEPDRPRPLSGLGPAALLLPVLSALAIGLFVTGERDADADPTPVRVEVAEGELEAWTGGVDLEGGGRVAVRLSPLQTDPRRQRFDREALTVRLGLPDGEPWRLEVVLTGRDGEGEVRGLRLIEPRVEDRDGAALGPLETRVEGPLATLLATPDEVELGAGESVQVVLWGRSPRGASARSLGLEVDGRPLECALAPLALHEADLPASVARRR